jgi:hypothetical protein
MVIAAPEQRTNGTVGAEPPNAPQEPPAATGSTRVWFWPDVAVGATAGAVDAVGALLAAAARAAARRSPSRADAERLRDDAGRARARVGRRITGFADRGAVQRQRSQRFAVTVVDAASTTVMTSPLVNRAVDLQLNRVLRPVVAAVLDDVLARLEAEPERVRSLVRGQRESMVDEIVGRVRAGALAGDTTVDRWTTRLLRRSPASGSTTSDPSPAL